MELDRKNIDSYNDVAYSCSSVSDQSVNCLKVTFLVSTVCTNTYFRNSRRLLQTFYVNYLNSLKLFEC